MPTSTSHLIRARAQQLTQRADRLREVVNTLIEANDQCSSSHSVAKRKGENVNWEAIKKRLAKYLKE